MRMLGESGHLALELKVFRGGHHGWAPGVEGFVDRPNEIPAPQINELPPHSQGKRFVSSIAEDFQKHDSVYAGMLGEQTGEEIFR